MQVRPTRSGLPQGGTSADRPLLLPPLQHLDYQMEGCLGTGILMDFRWLSRLRREHQSIQVWVIRTERQVGVSQRTLDQQRRAFLNDGPPSFERRKANLVKLRAVVLAHRREVEDAISADFGNRSRHETDIMELLGVVQSIDYLLRHLRRFMKPERRHVAAFHRAGRAYAVYHSPRG